MLSRRRRRGNRFRVHWTPERIIEKIREWHERHGEPPRRTDWNPTRCRMLAEAGQIRSATWLNRIEMFRDGDWPTDRTVVEVYGSWNEAIRAAGYTPRLPSQRTPRGHEPSHFLWKLGHAMRAVYEAEDSGDVETLRVALVQVANVATELAGQLEGDEEALAAQMVEEAWT